MKGVYNFWNANLAVSIWERTWLLGSDENNSHNKASHHPLVLKSVIERQRTFIHRAAFDCWKRECRRHAHVCLCRCSPVRREVMHTLQDMFNGATELCIMGLMMGMRCTLNCSIYARQQWIQSETTLTPYQVLYNKSKTCSNRPFCLILTVRSLRILES